MREKSICREECCTMTPQANGPCVVLDTKLHTSALAAILQNVVTETICGQCTPVLLSCWHQCQVFSPFLSLLPTISGYIIGQACWPVGIAAVLEFPSSSQLAFNKGECSQVNFYETYELTDCSTATKLQKCKQCDCTTVDSQHCYPCMHHTGYWLHCHWLWTAQWNSPSKCTA